MNSDGYQIVTGKKKALRELAKATLNMNTTKIKSGKQNKPLLIAKLAEKEPRQQIIQFSSSMTKFTGASITLEYAFRLVLEAVKEPADASIETILLSL